MELDIADQESFRRVMSRYATGVVVVTTRNEGVDHAMTANSFTSLSLDPLLVLVCVDRTSRFHSAVLARPTWAVNILGERHRHAASWFATRGRPLGNQFAGFPTSRGETSGALLLDGVLAAVECQTHAVYPGGDHDILVGQVQAMRISVEPHHDDSPLVYFRHGFRGLLDA